MPAIVIDIGHQFVKPDQTGQKVEVDVSSTAADPHVGGFRLTAQIGSAGFGPVFEDVEFGSFWNTFPHEASGGPLAGNAHLAQGEVAFVDGLATKADGALVDLTLDTTGVYSGTYPLKLTATAIENSQFFGGDGSGAPSVIVNGRVQVLSLWQNHSLPSDVNQDGQTSAIDLLLIINHVNKHGQGDLASPSPGDSVGRLLDTNGDGTVTAGDALLVVNCLNGDGCVAQPPVIATALQPPADSPASDPGSTSTSQESDDDSVDESETDSTPEQGPPGAPADSDSPAEEIENQVIRNDETGLLDLLFAADDLLG